jgi:uncharacterized protein
MNIRRLLLDVDKAFARPSVLEIAQAIDRCTGVEALNITITEIDMETVDMEITIEGEDLDYDELVRAIESSGAVVHSIDQLVVGRRTIERIERMR